MLPQQAVQGCRIPHTHPQPFTPTSVAARCPRSLLLLSAYITCSRIESALNLKMAITAGIGSDHVDLDAAMDHSLKSRSATRSPCRITWW